MEEGNIERQEGELGTQVSRLETEMPALAARVTELQAKCSATWEEREGLNMEISQVKKELEEHRDELEEKRKKLDSLEKLILDLKDRMHLNDMEEQREILKMEPLDTADENERASTRAISPGKILEADTDQDEGSVLDKEQQGQAF